MCIFWLGGGFAPKSHLVRVIVTIADLLGRYLCIHVNRDVTDNFSLLRSEIICIMKTVPNKAKYLVPFIIYCWIVPIYDCAKSCLINQKG